MRIGIISDSNIDRHNSALSQLVSMRDELIIRGHDVVFMTQTYRLASALESVQYHTNHSNIQLYAIETKGSISIIRGVKEWLNPYLMILFWQLRLAKRFSQPFDIVIWYSPSIFLTPFVHYLSPNSLTKKVLILRDIFPQWLKDVGGIKNGQVYKYLLTRANHQYELADIICLQSQSDEVVFDSASTSIQNKLRILENWLKPLSDNPILPPGGWKTIDTQYKYKGDIDSLKCGEDKTFLYAGNIGPAQKLESLIPFFRSLTPTDLVNFKFYSFGPNVKRLRETLTKDCNKYITFYPQVSESDLLKITTKVDFGLLCLDLSLKNNNIPGKYLFYLRSGIPILAIVNKNNDICNEIRNNRIGVIVNSYDPEVIRKSITALINLHREDHMLKSRCKDLFQKKYSASIAAQKLLNYLQ